MVSTHHKRMPLINFGPKAKYRNLTMELDTVADCLAFIVIKQNE